MLYSGSNYRAAVVRRKWSRAAILLARALLPRTLFSITPRGCETIGAFSLNEADQAKDSCAPRANGSVAELQEAKTRLGEDNKSVPVCRNRTEPVPCNRCHRKAMIGRVVEVFPDLI